MEKILLLNGPNINMLGQREKDVYGSFTLEDVEKDVRRLLTQYDIELISYQSNHEGDLVDQIQSSDGVFAGVIFNPAAYTHTSIALHDAIKAIQTPVIEVHISNIHQREAFRHVSMTAPACSGQIVGFGMQGYRLAAYALLENLNRF
ncbi:MAG TPA: type II 3-dehydroquinate dehydratase [Virgibacillus sp.]|nr:type II 3-dehydroquinate dehydratase [Virgibacillus sp.]